MAEDEPEKIDTPDPIADVKAVVHDLINSVEALGERVAKVEGATVKDEEQAVNEAAPETEHVVEEPPAVVVEAHVEKPFFKRLHDLVG